MDQFSTLYSAFTFSSIDFDPKIKGNMLNIINISDKDIGIKELNLLYNYLSEVYDMMIDNQSNDDGIVLQNKK